MRVGHKSVRAIWCARVLPDTGQLGVRGIGTTNSSELFTCGGAPRDGHPARHSDCGGSGNGVRSFIADEMATQPQSNVREENKSGARNAGAALVAPPTLDWGLTSVATTPFHEATAAATRDGAVILAGSTSVGAEAKAITTPVAAAGGLTLRMIHRMQWWSSFGLISPSVSVLASPLLLPLLLPGPQPPSSGATRSMSAVAPTITQELRSCISLLQIEDVVSRYKSRMRPIHHAEAVVQLGLLTYGSRSKQRVAARRLAAECTAAALASASGGGSGGALAAVGLDVLVVLVRGWGWVRKPPPELLMRMLEALVPGSSIRTGGGEHRHTQNTSGVRQGYGRLHTATLCDAAALVEPLAALEALTPPLLEVLINIAVRRAGNEASATVAAAAVAYGRAGVTEPRVAQAFLEATATRLRGGAAAASAGVGHIAEALNLCAKAAWYDPRVFTEAADALVARGVGGLTVRQTWSVLRAFAGTRHEHPLLKDALVAHAKALFTESKSRFEINFQGRDDPTGNHLGYVGRKAGDAEPLAAAPAIDFAGKDVVDFSAATVAAATTDVGVDVDIDVFNGFSPPQRQLSEERELTRQLSTLAGLVHGFSTMQVYDRELYERLAAGATTLLCRAMVIHLGESQPRALAAALTALLSGFAGAGIYPVRLLEVMTAQQQGWMRSISVEQAFSLTCALAQLRYRDERLLDRLDAAAAAFLEKTVATAAAAAGLLSPASSGSGSAAPATATTTAAAAAATNPDMSWLPSFLDAACRRLSYPCPRTVATLAAAMATWDLDEYGNTVLRGLSKGRKEKRERGAARYSPVRRTDGLETLSRLQLLLLLVIEQSRRGAVTAVTATAAAAAGTVGGRGKDRGSGSGSGSGSGGDPVLTPHWVCELAGSLANSGARLLKDEEQDLAWLLAKSIEMAVELEGGGAAAPAAAAESDESSTPDREPVAGGLRNESQTAEEAAAAAAGLWPPKRQQQRQRRRRQGLTPAQAAAALDDTAACHLFRAVIASQYFPDQRGEDEETKHLQEVEEEVESGFGYLRGEDAAGGGPGRGGGGGGSEDDDDADLVGRRGLEAALHRALTAPVAAAVLARAASAWHAAGLGTAAPRNTAQHGVITTAATATETKAAAVVAPPPPPPRRLWRGGGDAAHSPMLSELLHSLGLPVFAHWETADGFFRVSRGVVLPGGRHVAVEVLPDAAFAANTAASASAAAAAAVSNGPSGPYPVLIGDAAFRARCLAARGWRLVALPEGEWAAAAVAGPAACMVLMRRHSGGL
ncbi:hypothetical protein VaNZ11_005967 [Volvox africanus]|uniref:RAP domain-containing protein n=1 Tax=Volvox africanus TaxID=51714 RepID=A0ABQ5RZY0_9CHLO|nr:hypothetical protein VaNZ11_005967 [Volvox africanus]